MPSITLNSNRATEHSWFAWHPVVATKKGANGLSYHLVWMQTVQRKYVRAAGIGQWTYELV